MGLIDYVNIARRRWMTILAFVVLGTVAAAAYTSTLSYSYTSSSRLYVSMATGTSVSDAYQGNMAAQQRVTSYVNLVTSERVMSGVIEDLQLDTTPAALASTVTTSFAPATVLIGISVSDTTPDGARAINDAVVTEFRDLVNEIETTEIGAAPAAKVTVVDPATTPAAVGGPAPMRTLLMGAVAGMLLGCAAAYLRDRLDKRIRTTGQVAAVAPTTFLGDIKAATRTADARRAALRLDASVGRTTPHSIAVIGVSPAGGSDTVLALARALSGLGRPTLVVDGCTDGTGVSSRMQNAGGLADLARSPKRSATDLTRPSQIEGLSILPMGVGDDRTTLFLASPRFGTIVQSLKADRDYVVIDATSVADATDALAIAVHVDHVIVAVENGTTTAAQLRALLTELDSIGVAVAGTVLVPHVSARRWPLSLLKTSAAKDDVVPATSPKAAPVAEVRDVPTTTRTTTAARPAAPQSYRAPSPVHESEYRNDDYRDRDHRNDDYRTDGYRDDHQDRWDTVQPAPRAERAARPEPRQEERYDVVQSPADAETDRFHAVSAEPVQVPKDDAEDDVTEQDSIESDADDTITADVEDVDTDESETDDTTATPEPVSITKAGKTDKTDKAAQDTTVTKATRPAEPTTSRPVRPRTQTGRRTFRVTK
ncbi:MULTISPECIES: Wzz/FepE/Etk N-terminal domain-containing protein [Nocardiaceae]|uniref:Capsular polysaccharide biosynthesis protein n=1 Tax=Rhodococcoides corynebacterioides TaxID=53972 RepID=A0ABS2KZC9_9NOCA|nr:MULTISPECIES: Wzz/FepE/Etk N-terminal domain-containing protein [Rhodococcus]MBM7417279.1 capsular polysaccharide biosynthesis protein [Rhodococcus corynebacterioides]MBP1115532.1 capsular polysaccharide biosynthesis protein [Rhodococcus sp. PvP016]